MYANFKRIFKRSAVPQLRLMHFPVAPLMYGDETLNIAMIIIKVSDYLQATPDV